MPPGYNADATAGQFGAYGNPDDYPADDDDAAPLFAPLSGDEAVDDGKILCMIGCIMNSI